jgi:hypothetical protein
MHPATELRALLFRAAFSFLAIGFHCPALASEKTLLAEEVGSGLSQAGAEANRRNDTRADMAQPSRPPCSVATKRLDRPVSRSFTKVRLTDEFWSEAPAIGDINRDGHMDVVVGPYWYEGPDFKKRHMLYPATETFKRKRPDGTYELVAGFEGALGSKAVIDNTDAYFSKIVDLNGDGWSDVLVVGMEPGHSPEGGSFVSASWYENPGKAKLTAGAMWQRHIVAESIGNFNADFFDLFGNGRPLLLAMQLFVGTPGGQVGTPGGQLGYFEPDAQDAALPWAFHPISEKSAEYGWYTHGLGHGDVNGDGRADVLASEGWWEQPESRAVDALWNYHPYPFALGPGQIEQAGLLYDMSTDGTTTYVSPYGASQMYVADVNGDGLADVVMAIAAHGYGLAWWEQLHERDPRQERIAAEYDWDWLKLRMISPRFKRHLITYKLPSDNRYGVALTEMQAVAFADIDGDGLPDIVAGKRVWAHGNGEFDPQSNAPAELYWFRQTRDAEKRVHFVSFLIDADSGAGTQIAVGDIDGDGCPDIAVANKKGAFVFSQRLRSTNQEEWIHAQPQVLYPDRD